MSGVDSTGFPAAPDSLFSQGAIKVSGNNLVAVNPGSNTISMFTIDPNDPTKLAKIGQDVYTLGEFPVSVALSASLGQACVANSGAKAGVACFSMSSITGLAPLDTSLRAFDINRKHLFIIASFCSTDYNQETTPPIGPTNTVSQVFFDENSTALFTTVKGDPTKSMNSPISQTIPLIMLKFR